ncbi:hypothetical protein Smp_141020 [Schistosoma mansoni]|uniref:hypothetical protein n=1 Tax=Schistosoma mansoni TaxID=6183 RepID=UPI0001A644CA|nr:hypothetical protein Smp_141020 [Schistosoma mansoni]|eukprot:XP_018645157.1 hypothetical protein Smp_141020 [Schistosoma mansoni]
MRWQAHEVRTRLPSHVLVAEYAYPYAFATNLITNYGYGIGIYPYTTRKLHFSLFLSFFCLPRAYASDHRCSGIVDFTNLGESWPDHPRSSQRTQSISLTPNTYDIHLVPNMVILVASGSLAQSGLVLRLQRFWSGPLRTQPSDSGYKPLWCSMLIQAINTVRSFWYRSTSKTFGGNSRINDHSLFCQRLRPTIARFAISPTNETATYRKSKPFLAGGSCSDRPVSIRTRLE